MHRCDPLLLEVGGGTLAPGLGVRCLAAFGSIMIAAMQEVCCWYNCKKSEESLADGSAAFRHVHCCVLPAEARWRVGAWLCSCWTDVLCHGLLQAKVQCAYSLLEQ